MTAPVTLVPAAHPAIQSQIADRSLGREDKLRRNRNGHREGEKI